MPFPIPVLILMNGQGVEKFVGNDYEGAIGFLQLVDFLYPGGGMGLKGPALQLAQGAAGFEQDQLRCIKGLGGPCYNPHDIGHQGAPARPQFGKGEFFRAPYHVPLQQNPGPEHFSEHLGNFRGGYKIRLAAYGIGRFVISLVRMGQAKAHVGGKGHGAIGPYL